MSMDGFLNAMKSQTGNQIDARGQFKIGVVKSVHAEAYTVKCEIQPDGVMSGWLPVFSMWLGNGWGMACLPPPGTQVLIAPLNGDMENGIVMGALYSSADIPPGPARVGEFLLVHSTGTFLRLGNDGSVQAKAEAFVLEGDLYLNGKLRVDGDAQFTQDVRVDQDITAGGPILPSTPPPSPFPITPADPPEPAEPPTLPYPPGTPIS